MEHIQKMYDLTFEPFVGDRYRTSKIKILILGESHYYDGNFDNLPRDLTRNVVKNYLAYQNGEDKFHTWMRTFTRFANIFNGKRMSIAELAAFWHSVSFYNYVQYPTSSSRKAPSEEDFQKSMKPFHEVLNNLQPDLIVFWGHRLWYNFPVDILRQSEINSITTGHIELGKSYPCLKLYHPASSKLSYSHSALIKEYLEKLS